MIEEIPDNIFLFFAAVFFATSLTLLFGVGGKKTLNSFMIGTGFVLLTACFVWLWVT